MGEFMKVKDIMTKYLITAESNSSIHQIAQKMKDFDIGFMKYNCEQLGLPFEFTHIDTLRLAKAIYPEFSRYKLGFIADKLGIKVEVETNK